MLFPSIVIETTKLRHTIATESIQRIIGEIHGQPGPTVVFTAGIHGNEPTGVVALNEVFSELNERLVPVTGSIYMLAGNIQALNRNMRYIREDLNRIWTLDHLSALSQKVKSELTDEDLEQYELQQTINEILESKSGPFYFMDLHTTSSPTIPFMTVNDSLLNRKFTMQYPLPTILGIEEYLSGPILSHMNEVGYVAFGFEGGQHADPLAVANHKAFIYLSLHYTKVIDLQRDMLNHCQNTLRPKNPKLIKAFEIYHRHKIKENDVFKMEQGFENFQILLKDVLIATSNKVQIRTTRKGRIFMPLYQSLGSDGFFAIQHIPGLFLWISRVIRLTGLHQLFVRLPGISASRQAGYFEVNRKKARFLTKQFIHLFGYRIVKRYADHYVIQSREMSSRAREYRAEKWY